MSRNTAVRTERIELRARPDIKSVIERAAQLRHTTLSAYLIESALQKAKKDLKETETILLDEKDRDRFFALISSPPQPNAALRSLFHEDLA